MQFKDPEALVGEVIFGENIAKIPKIIKDGSIVAKSYSDQQGIAESYSVASFAPALEQSPQIEVYDSQIGSSQQKLYSIDSQAKMFTASAILRMMEEEKYKDYFPDGIDTKLSGVIKYLKEFYHDSKFITEELEQDPNYFKITIKDLALHCSGLVTTNEDYFPDFMTHSPNQKLSHSQMLDAKKVERSGRFGENYGEYFYNNIDYELLGAILVAVANKAHGIAHDDDSKSTYTQIINELVIDRVKDKLREGGLQAKAQNLHFFTSEQMQISVGKTSVFSNPESEVASTKHYYRGKFLQMPSHIYDFASGGAYSDAETQAILAFHILHSDKNLVFLKTTTP